jgi:hypothetical protein
MNHLPASAEGGAGVTAKLMLQTDPNLKENTPKVREDDACSNHSLESPGTMSNSSALLLY